MPHLLPIFKRQCRRRMTQPPPPPPISTNTLVAEQIPQLCSSASQKRHKKSTKYLQLVRLAVRTLPIFSHCRKQNENHKHGEMHLCCTLFGRHNDHISLAIQESPCSPPVLFLELAIPTAKLLQEMAPGDVRIALECYKCDTSDMTRLIDEPVWTMYCNGRKAGSGMKREPTEEEAKVLHLLRPVSMGVGMIPSEMKVPANGELLLTYVRAPLERVVGSVDSETYYMLNPDRNSRPELSICFLRI